MGINSNFSLEPCENMTVVESKEGGFLLSKYLPVTQRWLRGKIPHMETLKPFNSPSQIISKHGGSFKGETQRTDLFRYIPDEERATNGLSTFCWLPALEPLLEVEPAAQRQYPLWLIWTPGCDLPAQQGDTDVRCLLTYLHPVPTISFLFSTLRSQQKRKCKCNKGSFISSSDQHSWKQKGKNKWNRNGYQRNCSQTLEEGQTWGSWE